jgi:hypothetical protein
MTLCRAFIAAIVAVAINASMVAASDATRIPPSPGAQSEFSGFRRGEELRYQLGPRGQLLQGESAMWTLRLDEVREAPGGATVGVFELGYERSAFLSAGSGRSSAVSWVSTARAVVNHHGFPLDIRFESEVEASGSQTNYAVRYVYDGDSYDKHIAVDNRDRDQSVHIPNYDELHRDVPIGLYLFMPPSASCVAVNTTSSGRTGGSCLGRDAVFANPGLFTLTMPALWEKGTGEGEFLLFMPTITGVGGPRRGGGGGGGRSGGGGRGGGGRNRGVASTNSASNSFDRFTVRSEQQEQVKLQLGPRTVDAWRLEADSPVDAVYVDGNGRILRMDLEPQPNNPRRLYVRLLARTEY